MRQNTTWAAHAPHLAEARLPQARTVLQRQIDAPGRQIDKLVYVLYGLTEEEIRIVGREVG